MARVRGRLSRAAVGAGDDQGRAVGHQNSTPFLGLPADIEAVFHAADLGDRVGGGDEPLRGRPGPVRDDGRAGGPLP